MNTNNLQFVWGLTAVLVAPMKQSLQIKKQEKLMWSKIDAVLI